MRVRAVVVLCVAMLSAPAAAQDISTQAQAAKLPQRFEAMLGTVYRQALRERLGDLTAALAEAETRTALWGQAHNEIAAQLDAAVASQRETATRLETAGKERDAEKARADDLAAQLDALRGEKPACEPPGQPPPQ